MLKIVVVKVFLILFIFCSIKEWINNVQITRIRVINHSEERIANAMLFSRKFQDLNSGDTSAYQVLDFDPLRDDPLIYCSIRGVNYGRYLEIPGNSSKNVSYLIDSIQNGILYISTDFADQ